MVITQRHKTSIRPIQSLRLTAFSDEPLADADSTAARPVGWQRQAGVDSRPRCRYRRTQSPVSAVRQAAAALSSHDRCNEDHHDRAEEDKQNKLSVHCVRVPNSSASDHRIALENRCPGRPPEALDTRSHVLQCCGSTKVLPLAIGSLPTDGPAESRAVPTLRADDRVHCGQPPPSWG